MQISMDVPSYDPARGLRYEWDDGFEIRVHIRKDEVTIAANEAGLRSLARHLLMLAQDSVPVHSHIHLDSSNSLEDGSCQVVIDKIPTS
jgi:hypothetical protein